MSTKRRGFTIIEGLITLLLVSILLGAIGTLIQMYANVMRHADRKEVTLYAAELAVDTVGRDLVQAIRILDPDDEGDFLRLEQIDPWTPVRLPDPPGTPPPSWSPHRRSDRVTVSYRLDSASDPADYTFYRKLTYSDGGEWEEPICQGLHGVYFKDLGNGLFRVEASVLKDNYTVSTRTGTFYLHLPEELYP